MPVWKVTTNQRFGRLVAIERTQRNHNGQSCWLFRCDCGEQKVIVLNHVKQGKTRSCGCLRRENAKQHGEADKTAEYACWRSMIRRCTERSRSGWRNYGGRGIAVCDRWRASFEAFLADLGRKPSPQHSIDRIDNNGNYEPGNCRWATRSEQASNRRPLAAS